MVDPTVIDNIIHNLNKCNDAIFLENSLTNILQQEVLSPDSPLLKLEDNCLNLSASGSSDSIFSCTVLSVPDGENIHHIARFFEAGGFSGFYRNVAHEKIKEDLSLYSLLPYQFYNEMDVDICSKRNMSLFKALKKGKHTPQYAKDRSYRRVLIDNPNSIKNIVNNVKPSVEKSNCKCLFFICYVMHRLQKPTTSLDSGFERSDEIKQVEVKYVQKFSTSCRRYPASPRNRILQACNFRGSEEASEVVIAVLNCILGNIVEIPYYKNKKLPSTTRKRKFHLISKRNNRKNAEESDGDEADASDSNIQVDIMESRKLQNVASSSESLYQYFCGQLFNYGTFKWRVKSATKNVVVMNDYDCNTGEFMHFEYVHVFSTTTSTGPTYYCNCKIFSVSQTCVEAPERFDVRWLGVSCLHVRLLASVVSLLPSSDHIPEPVSADVSLVNMSVINDGLKCSETVVEELPAKLNVRKFSITHEDSAAIVSLFKVSGTNRKVVQCKNSLCVIDKGSKRSIKNITTAFDLCPHLVSFRDFYLTNNESDDVDDISDEDSNNANFLPDNKQNWSCIQNMETRTYL
ncbi:uncharacterized protein LOC130653972 isoform X2 [Hydractinia symbiolongicarpus]|uniref:uncharacterized protein LOC130625429 n=1 Tax=Hydractinia symbiolongicarpus TaxID=13093 RepID=UPI00254A3E98|nr:uncharacterized protein LOC130625429 [Hydractinia symbiolongicarpus]XP_057312455.1 uncharacterized protein LOC130653972 isoform X2 [Hydractinia symbiolongicarpus]